MANVTITGTPEQIAETLRSEDLVEVSRRRTGGAATRYERAVATRKLLRQAFDIVRHDSERRGPRDLLAGALGGRFPIDRTVMELARKIVETPALPSHKQETP